MKVTSTTDIIDGMSEVIMQNHSYQTAGDLEHDTELNSVLSICGYTPIIVVTIIGNLLVILAYCRHDEIRAIPTNTLIFSLSISDFLVGVLVLTINLQWVYRGQWMFGELTCRLWSILDYTVTCMSTITIFLISFDRFLMMTLKAKYRVVWTRRRIVGICIVCWLCCTVIYSFLAFSMRNLDLVDFHEECELEIVYLIPFTIGVLIFEFGIPFPLILSLNIAVYYKIHQRSKNLRWIRTNLAVPSCDLQHNAPVSQTHELRSMSHKDEPSDFPSVSNVHNDKWVDPVVGVVSSRNTKVTGMHLAPNNPVASPSVLPPNPGLNVPAGTQRLNAYRHRQRQYARHKKAAVTLSVLVGTFLICWLPYEIVSILQAMCGNDECFSETTWEAVNGLLWGNSALNPILYGLTNPMLRRHMFSVCRCPLHCGRPRVRVEPTRDQ